MTPLEAYWEMKGGWVGKRVKTTDEHIREILNIPTVTS